MSKKKKTKKRPINTKPPQYRNTGVSLSQCMIVKNEEKNIERALNWAKGFVIEQIVVDTGSTDRTVEIAKKNGATVYHFDWIDDFSAAKNYAMDKAKGNWIAILDADEYMLYEDITELMALLEKIQSDEALSNEYEAVSCSLVDFDEYERIISVAIQTRIFKNLPHLRYKGRIHEYIVKKKRSFDALNLRIFHTGYSKSAFADANKQERNLRLLRKEHERDPENPNIMLYLADMVKNDGTDDACSEAEDLFMRALSSKCEVNTSNKQMAYSFLIPRFIDDDGKNDEVLRLCNEAVNELPEHLDYFFYRAVMYNKLGKYEEARNDLAACETALSSAQSFPVTRIMVPSPLPLYIQLRISAQGMGDEEEKIKNTAIIKMMIFDSKDQTDAMGTHIRAMVKHGLTEDDALDELANFYDLHNPADLLFLARAAKESGAISFTRKIMGIAENVMKYSI